MYTDSFRSHMWKNCRVTRGRVRRGILKKQDFLEECAKVMQKHHVASDKRAKETTFLNVFLFLGLNNLWDFEFYGKTHGGLKECSHQKI